MIRFGILGTANIAKGQLIPAMKLAEGCVPFAVASRSMEKAAAFAAECGVAKAHGSYEDLLADPEVDAVYIPLPTGLHYEWALKCAEAGKHVLCEKPLTPDAGEAERLFAAFAGRGLLLSEGYMYRFHPLHATVRERIATGAIGKVRAVHATFHVNLPETDIRYTDKVGGGALLDLGCYCVGISRLITGLEPVRVAGMARFREGIDVAFSGCMEFPENILATFSCSLDAAFDCRYEIYGTNGRIFVERGAMVAWPGEAFRIKLWSGDKGMEEIVVPAANHYQLLVEAYLAALASGGDAPVPAGESLANLRAMNQLLASARHNQ